MFLAAIVQMTSTADPEANWDQARRLVGLDLHGAERSPTQPERHVPIEAVVGPRSGARSASARADELLRSLELRALLLCLKGRRVRPGPPIAEAEGPETTPAGGWNAPRRPGSRPPGKNPRRRYPSGRLPPG